VTEYADPDLETVEPRPPAPPLAPFPDAPPGSGGGPRVLTALVAALAIVALVVGFGVATIVLNARDSSPKPLAVDPGPTAPRTPFTPPTATPPSILDQLVVQPSDVPTLYGVGLLAHGADLTVATLDLCNGTFPSESQRVARRQVAVVGADLQTQPLLSTEAILYRAPSGGAQAFRELQSVAAKCPSKPVRSPVGEGTATTKFGPPPDATWRRTASVDRLAYDFHSIDASTGATSHSVAVYLRRGRALMGVYFANPDAAQVAVDGKTTIEGIVGVFEARLANLPVQVVGG